MALFARVPDGHEVLGYVNTIITEHHKRLKKAGSHITVVFRKDDTFAHVAKAEVAPPLLRFLLDVDAIIYVNQIAWEHMLNENQKRYHIDTALCMIDVWEDANGNDKKMPDGRLKLCNVTPIKIGFTDAIKRHGLVTEELKQFGRAMAQAEQMDIYDLIQMDEQAAKIIQFRGFPAPSQQETSAIAEQ